MGLRTGSLKALFENVQVWVHVSTHHILYKPLPFLQKSLSPSEEVTNPGAIFDADNSFDNHISRRSSGGNHFNQ